MKTEDFVKITTAIRELVKTKGSIIVAIDGRCGGGKTTLAEKLKEEFDCCVLHMDHFFLRPEQRSSERLNTPGENIDHERFFEEIIIPLSKHKSFSYRPFNCALSALGEPITVKAKPVTVIEGTYSCHKSIIDLYDLKIFADVSKEEQIKRLTKREGDNVTIFTEKWIPLEEKYFKAFDIETKCDFKLFM